MSDFFNQKGVLTVSIGEGWLSSFEAAALAPGDVVRTAKYAGHSSTLLFNGGVLCPCEVVIVGDLFGVRVAGMAGLAPGVPPAGAKDDVVELLPTVVSLGAIRVSLSELKGVGRNTIVSLGKPFSTDEDAELLVAGMTIARGKVVVIEEEMGIRVTRVMAAPSAEPNIRASGYLLDPHTTRRVKDYDFKRPDRFSKVAIDNVHDLHCLFVRNLSARLPDLAAALEPQPCPASVDQCTFSEALGEMRRVGQFGLFAAENQPRRHAGGAAHGRFEVTGRVLVEEAGTEHPVQRLDRAYIEKLAAEIDYFNRQAVLVYFREDTALAGILAKPEGREALLACLRGGWKNLVDLSLRPIPEDDPFSREPGLSEHEMVIIVTLNDPRGKPAMSLVYPYLTLEPLMGVLE